MSKPNKAKLLRKYKNLSRVLTTNNNMKIVFSGKQAFHIPGLINLPIGDFSDDDFITMSMGFCDHELGHENYTNSDWYHVAGKKSSYLKGLLNALDDFHQERRLIADFRGTRLTLRKLVELCKVKGIFTVLSNEAPIPMFIQAWVLYKARSYLGQPVSDFFNETDKQVLNTFGQQFYTDIHALLSSEVLEGLVSTEHCFNAAESIFQLLIDWIEDNQAEQEDSEGQGDSSNSDAMDDKKFTNEEVEEIIQSLEEYDDDFYDSLISTIEKMANNIQMVNSLVYQCLKLKLVPL
jgi:cobaltochelatase CobT